MNSSLIKEIRREIANGMSVLFELNNLEETDEAWVLGQISILKYFPCFRIGFFEALSNTSLFLKETCKVDGRELAVVIFRQWTTEEHGKPEELWTAGWVDRSREPELDKWIAVMNGRIEMQLQDRSLPQTPKTGGYGTLSGRWHLRYNRSFGHMDVVIQKILERAKGSSDFLTALEEAKEIYTKIYATTQRPINPLNPVSNPVVCYEEPLFPTI